MATANIKEVARHAGVSVGTVSNVLNRPDSVAPATRERVMSAIQELGFIRNEAARHLRAGRSRTVGLVVLDVIGFAAAAAVPLSSIRQPREQLGRAAIELLLDEVERRHDHTHRQVVFQPDLVIRESSRVRHHP